MLGRALFDALPVVLLGVLLVAASLGHAAEPKRLKVMTLNAGHARVDGKHQLLQSVSQAKAHLQLVAEVLRLQQPDVIALQEMDNDSFWNGRFNHSRFLARQAEYPFYFSGSHVNRKQLNYGTALVSNVPLYNSLDVPFAKPMARPGKGFVLSTIGWPGAEHIKVDVVSIHLDFLIEGRRLQEAMQLISVLRTRDETRPLIVMGDLNTEYEGELVPLLEAELSLSGWLPNEKSVTCPKLKKRLDWILVSDNLKIVSHQVLPDLLSDHRAIVAQVDIIES